MQRLKQTQVNAQPETIQYAKRVAQAEYAEAAEGAVVARHGDLYIRKRTTPTPSDAERVRNNEILRSNITGHVHAVVGEAKLFRAGTQLLVEVTGEGGLGKHAEHGAIQLAVGTYEIERKREYQDDGTTRMVMD